MEKAGADIVFLGARVYAADARYDGAEAVACKGGRILFVGVDADARAYIGAKTRVVECRGRALLPGMVDAHQHLLYGARTLYFCHGIAPEMNEAECLSSIRTYIADNSGQGAYICTGFAPERFERLPNRAALDAVCDAAPVVVLSYDGHTTWVSSRALEWAGIDENTPDPARGAILRGADGLPTGCLLGAAGACAGGLLHGLMPKFDRARNKESILRAQTEMLARGVTTIYDAHVEPTPDYFMAYEELARAGKLLLRTRGAWFLARETGGEAELCALIDRCAAWADDFQTDRFRVSGFKFLLDQTVEAGTAHVLAPYESGGFGVRVWEDGELLARLFSKIDRMGGQIHLHQMGDGAARCALDALERAGYLQMRHTFAHCQLIADADKYRMARLGISALVAPYWINSSAYETAVSMLGRSRAACQYPVKSLLDAGISVGAHSDYTVSEPSFAAALWGLTRRALDPASLRRFFPKGDPRAARPLPKACERVSLLEAVRILTLGGAYSMCEEGKTGSITPGKAADFALLSTDIAELCEAEVDMTVCAGAVAYEK